MFKKIHRYLEQITPARPAVLKEMESFAAENDFPIMGPLAGRFLYQMAMATKARRIMELGSGIGYSAFWFSLALKGKGHITMTDSDLKNKRRALEYFKKGGLQSRFEFKVGDALKIFKKLNGPFDIILNDIDKEDYPATIDLAAARLRKGGLFITDNLIWSGKVMDKSPDKPTKGIIEFTGALYRDSRFFTTVLPLRDGISVSTRL